LLLPGARHPASRVHAHARPRTAMHCHAPPRTATHMHADEKRAIARRYLEPTVSKEAGVPDGAAKLNDDAMEMLINEYCRSVGGWGFGWLVGWISQSAAPDRVHGTMNEGPASPGACEVFCAPGAVAVVGLKGD
jgi:hypothetical protein